MFQGGKVHRYALVAQTRISLAPGLQIPRQKKQRLNMYSRLGVVRSQLERLWFPVRRHSRLEAFKCIRVKLVYDWFPLYTHTRLGALKIIRV